MSFVNMKKSLPREKPSTDQNLNVSRTGSKVKYPDVFPKYIYDTNFNYPKTDFLVEFDKRDNN